MPGLRDSLLGPVPPGHSAARSSNFLPSQSAARSSNYMQELRRQAMMGGAAANSERRTARGASSMARGSARTPQTASSRGSTPRVASSRGSARSSDASTGGPPRNSTSNALFSSALIPPSDFRLNPGANPIGTQTRKTSSSAAVQSSLLLSASKLSFPKSPPAKMIAPTFGTRTLTASNALAPSPLGQRHVPSTPSPLGQRHVPSTPTASNALAPSPLGQQHVPSTSRTSLKRAASSNRQLSGSHPSKRPHTQPLTQPSTANPNRRTQPLTQPSTANPNRRTAQPTPGNRTQEAANGGFDDPGFESQHSNPSREEPPNDANGGFDDPGFENQHSNPSREETPKQVKNRRKRLDPSIVESLKHLEVDQLRQKVNTHAQYKRLTADDRRVFTKAYNKYQQEIHVMAAERLLRLNPVLKHLGNRGRFRGSTMYNNFCEYDVEARKSFYNYDLHQDDRKRECGRLWKKLNRAEKEQYKDLDFLASLPNPFGRGDCNGPDGGTSEASRRKNKGNRFFKQAETEHWSRKVMLDLKNLGAAQEVEGFLIMYKPKDSGGEVVSGGSFLGEQFVNMFSQDKKTNIEMNFLSFVGGQEVIRRATGQLAQVTKPRKTRKRKVGAPKSPWNFGSKGANYEAARDKLNLAISKATNGLHKQWPGKTTAATLKKLRVTLSIKDNEHGIQTTHFCGKPGAMRDEQLQLILRAFHEDLVVLTGPPAADAPKTLGADPDDLPTSREATQSSRTTLNKGSATNAKNARGSDSTTKSKKGCVSDKTKTASKESIKDKSSKKKQKKLTMEEDDDEEDKDKDKDEDEEDEEDEDGDEEDKDEDEEDKEDEEDEEDEENEEDEDEDDEDEDEDEEDEDEDNE